MIEDLETNSKQHLHDTQDDGHLHLVRVGEHKLVVSNVPNLRSKCNIIIISISLLTACTTHTHTHTQTNTYRIQSKGVRCQAFHGLSWELGKLSLSTSNRHTRRVKATLSNVRYAVMESKQYTPYVHCHQRVKLQCQ